MQLSTILNWRHESVLVAQHGAVDALLASVVEHHDVIAIACTLPIPVGRGDHF